MKSISKVIITVFAAVLVLSSGPVQAGRILDMGEANIYAGSAAPGVVPDTGRPGTDGWSSSHPGDSETEANYLTFDLLATPLNPGEGSIVATLRRDDAAMTEAIFSLVDARRHSTWVLQVEWYDPVPAVRIADMGVRQVLARNLLAFPGPVAPGDPYDLSVTWNADRLEVRVNGRDLGAVTRDMEDFREAISGARYLVVGAETDAAIPLGAWSQMHSHLTDFAAYDTFGVYHNGIPVVGSVTHDAFGVAGMSGRLVAGDTVTVTEKAEPGGKAFFDIVKPAFTAGGKSTPERVIVSDLPMTESADNPGTYTGAYTVKPGDHVDDGRVVGSFTNAFGVNSEPLSAAKPINIDGTVHLAVNPSNDLIPADESARSGLTIVASDANGKHVKDHPLKLTMSTTDEYTGTVGGGTFEDNVGGKMEVDWHGVTDSFGEVTAQYISGFAAKTILVSAKDMSTGDVGVGYVRAYIDGTVDIVVKRPSAIAQAISGSMAVTASRDWLTADGKSRSRITAVVKDASGHPVEGDNISFNLLGTNGSIRVVRSRTDSRGRATADYIAGTMMGQVSIEVRDMTSGLVGIIAIELRPDAPAEISLTADPGEIYIGGKGSEVTAKVTDVNGNPNADTDVLFEVVKGEGSMSAPAAVTDDRHGTASVTFLPGQNPGVSTVKGTVISRPATDEEIAAAKGAVFLYGLADDPGRLEVTEWFAKPGDEVTEGQDLVVLEDRHGDTYTVKAPRDGVLATFVAEERDRVEYGQTLGYVLPSAE